MDSSPVDKSRKRVLTSCRETPVQQQAAQGEAREQDPGLGVWEEGAEVRGGVVRPRLAEVGGRGSAGGPAASWVVGRVGPRRPGPQERPACRPGRLCPLGLQPDPPVCL